MSRPWLLSETWLEPDGLPEGGTSASVSDRRDQVRPSISSGEEGGDDAAKEGGDDAVIDRGVGDVS